MSEIPISVPSRVSGGHTQAITAEWANSISSAIGNLAKRNPPNSRPQGRYASDPSWDLSLVPGAGSTYSWKVSARKSCVTDGTNGATVATFPTEVADGFDFETGITEDSYIIAEFAVDSSLAISDPKIRAVTDEADAEEAHFDAMGKQDFARLLLGRIVFTTDAVPLPKWLPACDYPVICTTGIVNGAPVRVFERHPLNKDQLTWELEWPAG